MLYCSYTSTYFSIKLISVVNYNRALVIKACVREGQAAQFFSPLVWQYPESNITPFFADMDLTSV